MNPVGEWSPAVDADLLPGAVAVYREVVTRVLTAAEKLLDLPADGLTLGDASLAGGLAGLTVLADTVAAAPVGADGAWAQAVRARGAARLWRFVEESPAFRVSLLTGHTGLLWALAFCEPRALAGVSAAAAGTADTMRPEAPLHFDLVFGATGVLVLGRLLAARTGDRALADAAESWLVSQRDADGLWRTPRTGYRRHPPAVAGDFYYDWGVAHGIPGTVACLYRCAVEGGRPQVAAGRWEHWQSAMPRPPGRAGFPTFSGERGVQYGGNDAWCYGDAGAAAALVLAAAAGGADAGGWPEVAAASLRHALAAPPQDEPGLCHGTAGLLLIACRLYHATGERRFAAAARTLVERIVEGHRADAAPGAGLLRGAAGVALALHAALSEREPRWDMVLCLS